MLKIAKILFTLNSLKIFLILLCTTIVISCKTYGGGNYRGVQTLPGYNQNGNNNNSSVDSNGSFAIKDNPPDYYRKNIIKTAKKYIGTPYRYGGADPTGFDCSGFVMYVYGKNGFQLPRSASQQFKYGSKVNNVTPGDLVFFQTTLNKISHVGIYIGEGNFIHAPRTGKTVEIVSLSNSYYKKRLIGFKSYVNN